MDKVYNLIGESHYDLKRDALFFEGKINIK